MTRNTEDNPVWKLDAGIAVNGDFDDDDFEEAYYYTH